MRDLKKTMEGDMAIVSLEGRLQIDDTDQIETTLSELIRSPCKRIIVDLSQATYICSSALGVLIAAKKGMMRSEGELRLVATDGDIKELFRMTMLDKLFRVFGTVEEARNSFHA